jgi:hypothetical protein
MDTRVRYREIIADNLSEAGWSWGCVSAIDSNGRTIWIADAHRGEIGKRTRAGGNDTFSTMKTFLSIILAVAVSISTALAKHGGRGGHRGHGGYHGKHSKHFSSISPRGGRKFSRGGSGKYRNWSGRNWRGRSWSGGNWSRDWRYHRFSSDRFIFTGGYGYPYYWGWYPSWGWNVPYAYYSYYPYRYYPYDSCSVSRRQFFGP